MYLLLLAFTVILVFYFEIFKRNEFQLNISLLIIAVLLIILGSLRGLNVGNDLASYSAYYSSNYYYNIESGFVFLSKMFYILGFDFRFFLLVCQSLIVLPVFFIIYKYSKIKWLSVFMYQVLYLYANSFNIIRQSIAMSLVLYAVIKYIEESKTLKFNFKSLTKFLLIILISSQFHISSLVFIPIPLLLKPSFLKLRTLVILIGGFGTLLLFHKKIIQILLSLFNREYYGNLLIEFGPVTIFMVLFFIFSIYIFSNKKSHNIYVSSFYNVSLISLLIVTLGVWIPNYARLIMYYYLLTVLMVPNIIAFPLTKKNKILFVLFLMMLLIFYLMQLYFSDYGGVEPYNFLLVIF